MWPSLENVLGLSSSEQVPFPQILFSGQVLHSSGLPLTLLQLDSVLLVLGGALKLCLSMFLNVELKPTCLGPEYPSLTPVWAAVCWIPESCWSFYWHLPQCTGGGCGCSDPSWGSKKKRKMEGNRKAIFEQQFQKKQNVKGQILILVALFTDIGATSDKGMRLEFRQKCDSCVSEKGLYERNGQILTCWNSWLLLPLSFPSEVRWAWTTYSSCIYSFLEG